MANNEYITDRAADLTAQIKNDLSEEQHRYQIYDPFAEVTFRFPTAEAALEKVAEFGVIRFQYADADGTHKQIDNLAGQWVRDDGKTLAAVQEEIDLASFKAIEKRAAQRVELGENFAADQQMFKADIRAIDRIENPLLRQSAALKIAATTSLFPAYKMGLRDYRGSDKTRSALQVEAQKQTVNVTPEDIFALGENNSTPNVIESADSPQRQEFAAARALLDEKAQPVPTPEVITPDTSSQTTNQAKQEFSSSTHSAHSARYAIKHVLKTHELPANFQKKFLVSDAVPGKFFFHDRQQQLAFADQGSKLVTADHQPEVVRSMIELAKEKGWASVSLKGSDEFKREAWLQARLEGLEVNGFTPKPEDLARFEQLRDSRLQNRLYNGDVEATSPSPHPSQTSNPDKKTISQTSPTSPRRQIEIPDDYKPSPDAIAGTEHLRTQGVSARKVRLAMYGIDLSNQIAVSLGVPSFQARVFDAKASPQGRGKPMSIAIEKETKPIELSQPAPSLRR